MLLFPVSHSPATLRDNERMIDKSNITDEQESIHEIRRVNIKDNNAMNRMTVIKVPERHQDNERSNC